MAVLEQSLAMAQPTPVGGLSSRGIKVRLFLTCWLIYALHCSPHVYRELYLTMSLAEKHTIHVDDYVDLHPDLFVMPGRGSFLGNNPGTSILAAIPYWLSLPVVNRIAPVRPPHPNQKVSAVYQTSDEDRLEFYRKVRERGLDMHLGAAAMVTACFFMAPLTALSAVVMFSLLGRLKFPRNVSLWLTLLYALGTPIFFRTATISLDLVVAILGLFALALVWRAEASPERERLRFLVGGLIVGWTVVCDYTGVITVVALGLLILVQQLQRQAFWHAIKRWLWLVAGATGPVLFMLGWQWYCYGSPWTPAQLVMPKKYFMGYPSARGFGWPLPAGLWGLLFDPLYGLFVFAPIFVLALYHFVLLRRRTNFVPRQLAIFAWGFSAALWVFCSCIHYTLRWQWQDGVRYMVPVVPFLFLPLADVLVRIPRWITYSMAFVAVAETWCLSMVRDNPLESIARVLLHGFELPWLTTLVKTAPQYFPELEHGASPIPLFVAFAVLIWAIWAIRRPSAPLLPSHSPSTFDAEER
jgi:hypothetical protein